MEPVTPAHQRGFTLVVEHLTVCSYMKPSDTMMVLLSSAKSPKCVTVTTSWLSVCDHSGLTIDDKTRSPSMRYLRWTFYVTCQDIWNDGFVSTSDISINSCRSFLGRYITLPASYANRTEVLWSALIVTSSFVWFYYHVERCKSWSFCFIQWITECPMQTSYFDKMNISWKKRHSIASDPNVPHSP